MQKFSTISSILKSWQYFKLHFSHWSKICNNRPASVGRLRERNLAFPSRIICSLTSNFIISSALYWISRFSIQFAELFSKLVRKGFFLQWSKKLALGICCMFFWLIYLGSIENIPFQSKIMLKCGHPRDFESIFSKD